jgi:hypothetical protein
MNDYFHIYDPYYDVDDARRQYDWEECLDDWSKMQLINVIPKEAKND